MDVLYHRLLLCRNRDSIESSQAAELKAQGWQVQTIHTPDELPDPGGPDQPAALLLRLAPGEEGVFLAAAAGFIKRSPAPLILLTDRLEAAHAEIIRGLPAVSFLPLEAGGLLLAAGVERALEAFAARSEQAAELDDLYENAPVGYHTVDAEGRIKRVNQTELDWLGYTREEMIGHPLQEFMAPQSQDIFRKNFPLLKQRGWLKDMEAEVHCKDGSTFPVLVNATAAKDQQGRFVLGRSTLIDNRERVQAEQAASAKEAEKRAILDSLAAQIALLDEQGTVTAVNQSWLDFSGQNGGSLEATQAGVNYLAICDRAAEETGDVLALAAGRGIRDVMQGRLPAFELEYPCDSPTEKRWFLMHVTPSLNCPGGVVVSHDSITSQKQAEQALRESEERYRLLFENMQEGFSLHELAYDESGQVEDIRFLAVNAAYGHHTGLDPSRLVGRKMQEVQPGARSTQMEAYIRVALTGIPADLEYYSPAFQRHMQVRAFSPQPGQFALLFEDISSRVQAEQALRESEEKYRALFESRGISFAVHDLQSLQFIEANATFADLYGYTRQELTSGMTALDLLAESPEDRRRFQEDVQAAAGGKDFIFAQAVHRKQSGEQFPVEVHASVHVWNGRKVVHIMVKDIGERVQAEQALRESEARFRVALNSAPLTVFNQDANLRYTWIGNPGFGLTDAEVLGRSDEELFSPEEAALLVEFKRGVMTSGVGKRKEVIVSQGRDLVYIDMSVEPIFSPDGQVSGITCAAMNITKRKKDEQALQESEEKYRALFESRGIAFAIFDLQSLQIFEANATLSDLYGYTRRELTSGMTPLDLMTENQDARRRFQGYAQAAAGGEDLIFAQSVHQKRSGEQFPVEVHASVQTRHGRKVVYTMIKDISERVQAEQALRESEEKYRALFESQGIAFAIYDLQNLQVIEANATFADLYGYTCQELTSGMTTLDLLAEKQEDRSRYQGYIQAAFGGKDLIFSQAVHRKKSGEQFPVEGYGSVHTRHGRKVVYAMVRDISERVQAEQALRESEERYRLLFENIQEGFVLFEMIPDDRGAGVDFRFLAVNAAYEHHTGLKTEQVVGRTMLEVMPNASREQMAAYARVVQTGEPMDLTYYSQAFQRHLHVRAFKTMPGCLAAAFEDVTQHVEAEEKLRYSEAVLTSFFDGIQQNMGILRAHPETNDLEFLRMNRVALNSSKVAPEALPGALASQHGMSEMNRRLWLEECQLCQESGKPLQFEYQSDKLPGRWMLVSLNCIEPGVFSYAAADISELKRLQYELSQLTGVLEKRVALRTAELGQANRELERAVHLRDEFLNNLSHELRTPLTGILGVSEALRMQVYGEVSERQKRALEVIASSGARMQKLVEQLLLMTQVMAGKVSLETGFLDVGGLVRDCISAVQGEVKRKKLTTSISQDMQLDFIVADEARIKQILEELLDNAVKFTPEGGQIGLDVAGDEAAGVVRWVVWDTGIGISPEQRGELFELFVQLERGLSRPYGGMGMGLALVNELVKLHGGSIQVESEPGQGSRFTVSLPWVRPGG
jgi:PAS domain S-box-containing protein